jgi:hypothetical protein
LLHIPNMTTTVNIKPRVSSFSKTMNYHSQSKNSMNDASPAFLDDHDDDNDKDSKIQRTSRQFLIRSVVGLLVFAVLALGLDRHLQPSTPFTARQSNQKSQAQLRAESSSSSSSSSLASNESVSAAAAASSYLLTDQKLAKRVHDLDVQVRARKATKDVIMETDPQGMELTKSLQEATLALLKHRYGPHEAFRVRIDVTYPDSIPSDKTGPARSDYFLIQLAPFDLIPCSVFYFLEIARTYISGSFHRNANHVLQAQASSKATAHHRSMPFQEYHPDFPHAKYTTGYAGRPSGPGWYVSIQDNTLNHGPGSQQKQNPYEADSLFGKLVSDTDNDDQQQQQPHDFEHVIKAIHSVPQQGWLDDKNHIAIPKMTILVPSQEGGTTKHKRWIPWTSPIPTTNQEDPLTLV